MKQINMKQLFAMFDGISLDIFTNKHQGFYATPKSQIPSDIDNYEGRARIESIRFWDFRYENGPTQISIALTNKYGGATTFTFPKPEHFENANLWNVMDIDLIRMTFECQVRINS